MKQHLFFVLLVFVVCCRPVNGSDLVATLFSNTILRTDLQPDSGELEKQQAELTSTEFEAWLKAAETKKLASLIKAPFLKQLVETHNLAATDAQLAPYRKAMAEKMPEDLAAWLKKGTPESNMLFSVESLHKGMIQSQNIAEFLHRQYGGGRVAVSSFGFTIAIDAEARFLKAEEEAGSFRLHDADLAQAFWESITNQLDWADAVIPAQRARDMFKEKSP